MTPRRLAVVVRWSARTPTGCERGDGAVRAWAPPSRPSRLPQGRRADEPRSSRTARHWQRRVLVRRGEKSGAADRRSRCRTHCRDVARFPWPKTMRWATGWHPSGSGRCGTSWQFLTGGRSPVARIQLHPTETRGHRFMAPEPFRSRASRTTTTGWRRLTCCSIRSERERRSSIEPNCWRASGLGIAPGSRPARRGHWPRRMAGGADGASSRSGSWRCRRRS